MTIVLYILPLLTLLAIWHFVYEGMLAPTWRMKLRNDLFECRDHLRSIWMEGRGIDERVFLQLQESLNNGIAYLHALKISRIYEMHSAVMKDEKLRKRIANRRAIIENCPDSDIRDLDRRLGMTIRRAVLANAGGWLIWIVPIAICLRLYHRVYLIVTELLAMPGNNVHRYIDDPAVA